MASYQTSKKGDSGSPTKGEAQMRCYFFLITFSISIRVNRMPMVSNPIDARHQPLAEAFKSDPMEKSLMTEPTRKVATPRSPTICNTNFIANPAFDEPDSILIESLGNENRPAAKNLLCNPRRERSSNHKLLYPIQELVFPFYSKRNRDAHSGTSRALY